MHRFIRLELEASEIVSPKPIEQEWVQVEAAVQAGKYQDSRGLVH